MKKAINYLVNFIKSEYFQSTLSLILGIVILYKDMPLFAGILFGVSMSSLVRSVMSSEL